jgi:cytochrome c553
VVRKRAPWVQARARRSRASCSTCLAFGVGSWSIVKSAGLPIPRSLDMKSLLAPDPAARHRHGHPRRARRCRQARPGQGTGRSAQVCVACHTADGSRGSPCQPHPGWPACRLPRQAAHRVQVGQARQRHHVGHGRHAGRRGHEERRRLLQQQEGRTRRRAQQGLVLLGEKIYRGGIAAKQVPACAGCHSPSAPACPPQYPRLAGQHADYTEAQLVAFRSGAARPIRLR